MSKKILLTIPAYNCEAQIGRVIKQVTPLFGEFIAEVLVIDNRSSDGTLNKAVEEAELVDHMKVTVIQNNENFSLGGTHKVAFKYCSAHNYSGVIILHGDDQGALIDFLSVLKDSTYKKYDCILGARFSKMSRLQGYSRTRVIGNHIFNWLYTLVAKDRVYDMGSGLNFYNASLIDNGFYKLAPDDLTFNNYMLLASYAHKMKIYFKDISWREEDQVSNAKLFKQAFRLIDFLFQFYFLRKKFISKDFRDTKRVEYEYNVIYSNNKMVE